MTSYECVVCGLPSAYLAWSPVIFPMSVWCVLAVLLLGKTGQYLDCLVARLFAYLFCCGCNSWPLNSLMLRCFFQCLLGQPIFPLLLMFLKPAIKWFMRNNHNSYVHTKSKVQDCYSLHSHSTVQTHTPENSWDRCSIGFVDKPIGNLFVDGH